MMKMRNLVAAMATASLVAAPVMAAPARVTNPAASLSVAKSARASTPADKSNRLAGAGILGLVIAGGIVAIGVIAIINESEDDDDSDSN